MKNYLEYCLFLILAGIVRLLGLKISRRLSIIIALIFYYIIPIRKKVTLKNLHKAFPEYSENKIKKIAFGSYKSFSIALVEILFIPFMTREQIENAIYCENVELVKKYYKRNNGLIVLSGHFGNWEYIALSVSAKINVPFHVVVKSQRNPYVDAYLNRGRTRWINKIVPLGASIRKIYSELKAKNVIAMVADQRGPQEGMRVNFFGQQSSIYPGPAMLAIKTGAPVLYGLTIRQPDYSYAVLISEISTENLPADEEKRIQEVSQRHMAFLESVIRKHPEQWLWMHNIWKY
jgi:Kdo2-lipid IVA lauroyltransferase/acyltransferase